MDRGHRRSGPEQILTLTFWRIIFTDMSFIIRHCTCSAPDVAERYTSRVYFSDFSDKSTSRRISETSRRACDYIAWPRPGSTAVSLRLSLALQFQRRPGCRPSHGPTRSLTVTSHGRSRSHRRVCRGRSYQDGRSGILSTISPAPGTGSLPGGESRPPAGPGRVMLSAGHIHTSW